MSLNINFKKSSWKTKKWLPVTLSEEFNNVEYYSVLVGKRVDITFPRFFEMGYFEYLEVLNNNKDIPQWFLSKASKLEFKASLKDDTVTTELVGWNTYKIDNLSKYTRRNFRHHVTPIPGYQMLVKLSIKAKPSNKNSAIIRKILDEAFKVNTKLDLINLLLNNTFYQELLYNLRNYADIKAINFEKLKQI